MAERWTVDPNVAGSSPAVGIFIIIYNLFSFNEFYFTIFNFLKIGKLQTFIYNNKYIILMSIIYTHIVCPGGVGAIMWACRARDSGSNPGQGA